MSMVSTLKWKFLHPNLYCDLFGVVYLYSGVDIILVKKTFKTHPKHVFSKYEIDPNYGFFHVFFFFFNFSIMSPFPN